MIENKRIVKPGPSGSLIGEKGEQLTPPNDWFFLPAGDAGITRKVTAQGEFWRVQIIKGRRFISKGIWAPATIIKQAKNDVRETRATDDYQKKRVYNLQRREKKQNEYELEFCKYVEEYLHFHPKYKNMEKQMAKAITEHAIPVGSGTVARTAMIPIEERASRAVIAWMRHQTTAYDHIQIAHIKGERRAVRREFAK
ncbi:MAG: DUF2293 domain-containing protein, partial [Bacteroidales bacterium]|nr:DUF2293 domain-containing protein [Bacteroidales bacterium]